MRVDRILTLAAITCLLMAVPGAGAAEDIIATTSGIPSPPAAGGDLILWIEKTPSLPYYSFLGRCAVHTCNITTGVETLVRSRATNARSPDIDGAIAVWEEERGTSTDIVMYNTTAGTVVALHTPGLQRSPRVSDGRIVWEEGFAGSRTIWLYDLDDGGLHHLSRGEPDCFSPDISGNTVVWCERDGDAYSVVSLDLVTGRPVVCARPSGPVTPRIDGACVVWEDAGAVWIREGGAGASILAGNATPGDAPVVRGSLVAWAGGGGIRFRDLRDTRTMHLTGRSPTGPALLAAGIAWVEEDSVLRYRGLPPSAGVVVEAEPDPTSRAVVTRQRGLLREGECDWYALDVSPGSTRISLDCTWGNESESLSCTLIGPGGAVLRFTDGDDGAMDGRVRISVTSPSGLVPGRWYCAASGDSVRERLSYAIAWYEW